MASGTSIVGAHPTIANLWVRETDSLNSNLILSSYCNGVPDTTANTYSHGCIMVRLDSGTGTNAVYQNTGSGAVPAWTLFDTGTGFSIPTSATDASTTTADSFLLTESTLTTGNGIRVLGTTANFTTGGALFKADLAAALAGNGFVGVTTGVYTGTGLLTLTANSATTGTIEALSATGLTSGTVSSLTGGGANFLTGGIVSNIAMGAATLGSGVKIVTTGVYTDTANAVLNIVASSATTGNIAAVTTTSSKALVIGQALATPAFQVDSSTASQIAGLKVTGAITGGTVALVAIDSGANTSLTLNAKGTGTLALGSVSTGQISIGRGLLGVTIFSTTTTALGSVQNSTPTAAQLLGGIISQVSVTGGGTITLPTGTLISGAVTGVTVGDTFQTTFANIGTQTLTVTANSGITVVGTATIATLTDAILTFVNTGANTWICYTNK